MRNPLLPLGLVSALLLPGSYAAADPDGLIPVDSGLPTVDGIVAAVNRLAADGLCGPEDPSCPAAIRCLVAAVGEPLTTPPGAILNAARQCGGGFICVEFQFSILVAPDYDLARETVSTGIGAGKEFMAHLPTAGWYDRDADGRVGNGYYTIGLHSSQYSSHC